MAEEQPTGMAGGRRLRPSGQIGERDRQRIFDLVRQPTEARAQDDPDDRAEVRPRPDGSLECQEPGRLLRWLDRAAGIDGLGVHGDVPQGGVRVSTGISGRLCTAAKPTAPDARTVRELTVR
jgi:hypothetical protein